MNKFFIATLLTLSLTASLSHARDRRGGAGGVSGGGRPNPELSIPNMNCFDIKLLIKEYREANRPLALKPEDIRKLDICGISYFD